MLNKLLETAGKAYLLKEHAAGAYSRLKIRGIRFDIHSFTAEGLGHVSAMSAKGFFGLMQMDTFIITPFHVDMPLLSYDRMRMAGKDIMLLEMVDTMLERADLSPLAELKRSAADLPDYTPKPAWYEYLDLPENIYKQGNKAHRKAFDQTAESFVKAYLACAANANPCDAEPKREKSSVYVEGLLSKGGVSTDLFVKGLGREKTAHIFRSGFAHIQLSDRDPAEYPLRK